MHDDFLRIMNGAELISPTQYTAEIHGGFENSWLRCCGNIHENESLRGGAVHSTSAVGECVCLW